MNGRMRTSKITPEQAEATLKAVLSSEQAYVGALVDVGHKKPLCDIALRYKLGDILIKHEDKPDEVFKAAAAYDIHGKKLGLVTAVMHEGASASLMHGAPPPGEGERWQWLEKGREQVEQLLKERPELESKAS